MQDTDPPALFQARQLRQMIPNPCGEDDAAGCRFIAIGQRDSKALLRCNRIDRLSFALFHGLIAGQLTCSGCHDGRGRLTVLTEKSV